MLRKLEVIVLLSLLLSSHAFAQLRWTPVISPRNDSRATIILNPSGTLIGYLANSFLSRSTDQGKHWTDLPAQQTKAICYDSLGVLYTDHSWSSDNGDTWSPYSVAGKVPQHIEGGSEGLFASYELTVYYLTSHASVVTQTTIPFTSSSDLEFEGFWADAANHAHATRMSEMDMSVIHDTNYCTSSFVYATRNNCIDNSPPNFMGNDRSGYCYAASIHCGTDSIRENFLEVILHRSSDFGCTWIPTDSVWHDQSWRLIYLPDGKILRIYDDSTMGLSTDHAQHWQTVPGHAPFGYIRSSRFDSFGRLLVGIGSGDSAHYYYLNGWEGVTANALPHTIGLEIFPNPSHATPMISVELTRQASVTLEILDVLGHAVMRKALRKMREGRTQLDLGALALTPGTYYCRLSTGVETATSKFVLTP